MVIKPEPAPKFQTVKAESHHRQLRSLALMFLNALHTVGLVEIGQVVPQMVIKHALAVKIQVARVEHNRQRPLNLALIPHPALPTLGNAVIGELAHRKESKPEVAIKLMIVRPRKQRHQQHRNIAKLQISPNNKPHRKI